ncbi:hypothetical protein [Nostoc sp. FACHB-110]|nr:hypothetical protein [Nostoc sp. FACHB-110]
MNHPIMNVLFSNCIESIAACDRTKSESIRLLLLHLQHSDKLMPKFGYR